MEGKLYLVATPIGNLEDITLRALRILKEVDLIAAEDTRHTLGLLNHFEIKKPLISYYKEIENKKSDVLISKLKEGQNIAIVSDAGTPGISDPGEEIVKKAIEENIEIIPVPGACAFVNALIASGFSTREFSFIGFLSANKKERKEKLEEIKNETRTMIFYEAPHKLIYTLQDMLEYFGDRKISLCRELTKVYEEVIRLTLSEAIEYYKEKNPKGEYVLVIEGKEDNSEDKNITLEEALERVKALVENGVKTSDACKTVAKESTFKKGELYSAYCNTEQ